MKVSIIIPTFNSVNTIIANLDSIKSQTYKNYEIVVIDNCSSDKTINEIKKYNFQDIKLIIENDKGIYDAFNKGISLASGEIISHLNSDDFYSNNRTLEIVTRNFKNNIQAVYGNITYVSYKNPKKVIRFWKSCNYIKGSFERGWSPPHPGFFFKKNLFNIYGSYNTQIGTPADIMFMHNLLEVKNINTKFIDQDFVTMRTGGKSNESFIQVLKQNYTLIKHLGLSRNPFKLTRFIILKFIIRVKQFIMKS